MPNRMPNIFVGLLTITILAALLACGGRNTATGNLSTENTDTQAEGPDALPTRPAPPRTTRPFVFLPMFAGTWEHVKGREYGSMDLFVDGQFVRGTGNDLAVSLLMELGEDGKLHGYLDTNTFENRGGLLMPVKVPLTMELSPDMMMMQVTGPHPPDWTAMFRRTSELKTGW